MTPQRKSPGVQDIDYCRKEALNYVRRVDFQKGSKGTYLVAHRNGWLDDICSHMPQIIKPVGYWSYEKCAEVVKRYKYLVDFVREQPSAHVKIRQMGWVDLLTHLEFKQSPRGNWNIKSFCQEEALKHSNRSDFNRLSRGAYDGARRNGWLEEICSHMVIKPSITQRFVYEILRDGAVVYVGISVDPQRRFRQHVLHKRLTPECKLRVVCGPIPAQDAQAMEKMLVEKYDNLMNVAVAGSLGKTKTFLTKSYCRERAKQYESRSQFAKNDGSSYQTACREGWLEEICSHMVRLVKPVGFWQNKENCEREAMKHLTKKDFRMASSSAYQTSYRNGWLDEFFPK